MSIFEKSTFNLNELITNNEPLVILAGAGISINSPSNLASASKIIHDIVKFSTGEELYHQLLQNEKKITFRFESIMQMFRNYIDREFKFIEYFELAQNPNSIHRFIAEMMNKGHFAMTTNFDTLIERAMGLEDEQASVVITQSDFEKNEDPGDSAKNGLKILYKIHGSKTNIFTGEDTSSSIIATLDALGKDKDDDIFSVQGFKRKLFANIGKDRNLLIMGYSGGDDFDVVPVLRKMNNLKSIIWIDHDQEDSNEILQVRDDLPQESLLEIYSKNSQLDRELLVLKNNLKIPIIKIQANTMSLIESLALNKVENISMPVNNNSPEPYEWLKETFDDPPQTLSIAFTLALFFQNNLLEQAKQLLHKTLDLIENENEFKNENENVLIGDAIRNLSLIEKEIGDPLKAEEMIRKALKFHINLDSKNNLEIKNKIALDYSAMSKILLSLGKFKQALEYELKAMNLFKTIRNFPSYVESLAQIGRLYLSMGDHEKSLKIFQDCLDGAKKMGNLHLMAGIQGDIGNIYLNNGDPQKAFENHQKAYQIQEKLRDYSSMIKSMAAIGGIYQRDGKIKEAFDVMSDAYKLANKIGNTEGMIKILASLGSLKQIKGEKDEALKYYQEAFKISKKLNDTQNIGKALGLMGALHLKIADFENAMKFYQQAYAIHKGNNFPLMTAEDLVQIARINIQMRKFDEAIEGLNTAYSIYEQEHFKAGICNVLNYQAYLTMLKGDPHAAYSYYEKSYNLAKEINNPSILVTPVEGIGEIYVRFRKFSEAIKYYAEAKNLHQKSGNMHGVIVSTSRVGMLFAELGKKPDSLTWLNEALRLAKLTKLTQLIPVITNQIKEVNQKL